MREPVISYLLFFLLLLVMVCDDGLKGALIKVGKERERFTWGEEIKQNAVGVVGRNLC